MLSCQDVPMKIELRQEPDIVSASVRQRVRADVEAALQSVTTVGDQFVVNDTPWFVESGGTLKARVTNTADYISRTFQKTLKDKQKWKVPRAETLDGQEIDGYIELPVADRTGYHLDQAAFRTFFDKLWDDLPQSEDMDREFQRYYQTYHRRDFFGLGSLAPKYHSLFATKPIPADAVLKIGLEFETGNIASSFRALWKLNVLFLSKKIDAGVFIISRDKAGAAARIWPASNRNGSFEELEQRNYKHNVLLPLWEFSFAPDSFDRSARYLGKAGQTYTMTPTGRTQSIRNRTYEVWTALGGKELLCEAPSGAGLGGASGPSTS
jgi:hypothetical protein